jgi:hypothetical protein
MRYANLQGQMTDGYFCANCGLNCNMYASGHGAGKCKADPKRVKQLRTANPGPVGAMACAHNDSRLHVPFKHRLMPRRQAVS